MLTLKKAGGVAITAVSALAAYSFVSPKAYEANGSQSAKDRENGGSLVSPSEWTFSKGEIHPLFGSDLTHTGIINGNADLNLQSLKKERVIVLDMWATWCGPCQASTPRMNKFVEQHPEAQVITVTEQSAQEIFRYLDDPSRKLAAPKGIIFTGAKKLETDLGVTYLPTLFVLVDNAFIRVTEESLPGTVEREASKLVKQANAKPTDFYHAGVCAGDAIGAAEARPVEVLQMLVDLRRAEGESAIRTQTNKFFAAYETLIKADQAATANADTGNADIGNANPENSSAKTSSNPNFLNERRDWARGFGGILHDTNCQPALQANLLRKITALVQSETDIALRQYFISEITTFLYNQSDALRATMSEALKEGTTNQLGKSFDTWSASELNVAPNPASIGQILELRFLVHHTSLNPKPENRQYVADYTRWLNIAQSQETFSFPNTTKVLKLVKAVEGNAQAASVDDISNLMKEVNNVCHSDPTSSDTFIAIDRLLETIINTDKAFQNTAMTLEARKELMAEVASLFRNYGTQNASLGERFADFFGKYDVDLTQLPTEDRKFILQQMRNITNPSWYPSAADALVVYLERR